MTDQHPLTDEICAGLASEHISSEDDYIKLRAGADWQLEQVIEWLKEHAAEYAYEDYYGPCFNDNGLLDDLKEAMRPTTQEDLEDVQLVLERMNSIPEPITLEELMTLDDTTQEDN